MKKSEFKQMIKESVKEVLIEEGVLKNVISEVVKAVGQSQVTQSPSPEQLSFTQQASQEAAENKIKQLAETRKKMLDAIGNDAYNGVNLFEGTTPTRAASDPGNGPLSGTDPGDPCVDITKLPNFNVWKKLAGN